MRTIHIVFKEWFRSAERVGTWEDGLRTIIWQIFHQKKCASQREERFHTNRPFFSLFHDFFVVCKPTVIPKLPYINRMLNGFECLTADQLVLKHLSTWRQVRESDIAHAYMAEGMDQL